MKDIILKLSCLITGFNYKVIRNYDGWSRRKVSIYAIALFLPVSIWYFNGFLVATNIIGTSVFHGILIGAVCFLVIYCIEKIIILGQGGWMLGLIRLMIACSSAILVSFSIKEIIFQADINNALAEKRLLREETDRKAIELKFKPKKDELQSELKRYNQRYNTLMDSAQVEARRHHPGPITMFYVKEAKGIQNDLIKPAQYQLDSLNGLILKQLQIYQDKQIHNEGLWTRIDAFIDLSFKNARGRFVFFIFFTFFLCIEMFVWVLKLSLKPSLYEQDEKLVSWAVNSAGTR